MTPFLGLAVATATARASSEACRQSVGLGAVVQNPAFVMMEEATVVVRHVESGGEADLPEIGDAGDAARVIFGAGESRQEETGQHGDDQGDD